ncbi:MAG: 6,7-dimethyl-8-ribityllumazine synthase [Actinobacteria bacterium]|nr:6,7-dimethyl-8-ribityllumazine synthase [Actinomycetota bacterium]MCB9425155.1 6,7-dimethyl-8-ribityllumazine synthase [Actinomycetota bacterium]HRY09325.1 6,7-dimethyl-8-ribityllumazine synthase [Candidatus Nanopelagicales bacterium]
MSGEGRAEQAAVSARGVRVAVVAASWHEDVMAGLLAGARSYLAEVDADVAEVRVPGSFEIPIVAARLATTHDVVVALGVIIRGGTPHFEYVCNAVTDGLGRVALDSGTPVGFGILTCDTLEQALDRAGGPDASEDKGREAAAAAVETWTVLQQL